MNMAFSMPWQSPIRERPVKDHNMTVNRSHQEIAIDVIAIDRQPATEKNKVLFGAN